MSYCRVSPKPSLTLRRTTPAHDGPDVHYLVPFGNIVAVVTIRAHVQIAAVDFNTLAQFQVSVATLPLQRSVFGALRADLDPRHALNFVGRPHHSLVSVVSRHQAGVKFRVHGC